MMVRPSCPPSDRGWPKGIIWHVLLLLTDDECTASSAAPVLKHVISSHASYKSITAVTSLGDDIFVLRRFGRKRVQVYDANTFKFRRYITIPEIYSFSLGIAACDYFKCLYVSNSSFNISNNIYRVDLRVHRRKMVKTWNVLYIPFGMSVNNAHNLTVTYVNKIQEYTTDGSPVREICLQEPIMDLNHAIQLSTGDYVVINRPYNSPDVVSIVGEDGIVRRTSRALDGLYVDEPCLAVTKNNVILVAESSYNRILSTNHLLNSMQELHLPVYSGIIKPSALYVDESKGRLYVVDAGENYRLLVFENVKLQ